MSNLTLVTGDIIKNNRYERIEVLHSTECRDLAKLKTGPNRRNVEFTEYATIEDARTEYDSDDLGWEFDEEVRILPCVHNK